MAERLPIVRTALDILRCSYGSEAAVAQRQRQRLMDLLRLARERSGFYRNLYAHLPDAIADLSQLPFVTKPELMNNFDELITDPEVRRLAVEAFLADLTKIGEAYLGRYFVRTTSGTTGQPGIFLHDEFAWLVYQLLGLFRGGPIILGSNPRKLLTRSPRVALLAVGGGHFGGAAGFAWRTEDSAAPGQIQTNGHGSRAASGAGQGAERIPALDHCRIPLGDCASRGRAESRCP